MSSEASVSRVRRSRQIPLTYVVALVPIGIALNVVGGYIQSALRLPVFLDMIGTGVAAMVIGPWWGVVVGGLTNVILAMLTGPISLPFAVVNIVGALIWGYAVRLGLARTFLSFGLLNIVVAIAASVTATPIYVFVFGGATGHFADMLTAAFIGMGRQLAVAVFSSNILVSLADKIISGFVALAIIEALPANLTAGLKLPKSEGLGKIAWIAGGIVFGVAVVLVLMALGIQ
jgi:energy-coupling factor transport system substrate-specific component